MNTIVYVDGYNLFYGRLSKTCYKWLDVHKLAERIIQIQNPESNITYLKYFSAPIKARFSSSGTQAPSSQDTYHRALQFLYPNNLEIILGYHTVQKGRLPKYQKPIDTNERLEVWNFEEKQTDVNLAIHMYKDAAQGKCEQQILISNDTDLEAAVRYIHEDFPKIHLGLIVPRNKPTTKNKSREPAKKLTRHVDWVRRYILDDECDACLLPTIIPTRKKPIIKPDYW